MLIHSWTTPRGDLRVERMESGDFRIFDAEFNDFALHLTEREALDLAEKIERLSVEPAKAAA